MLDLRSLPGSFGDRLRDAPVILLYLSPGFSERDVREARTARGRGERRGERWRQGLLGQQGEERHDSRLG
jgi:hypothetical protein